MHHCAVVSRLLRENDFLSSWLPWDSDEAGMFRLLLVKAILGTDMTLHGSHVKTSESLKGFITSNADCSPLDQRLKTIEILVHAADIGIMTLPWSIATIFSDRIMAEFTLQAEMEEKCGLPVTPYMQGLRPDNRKGRGTTQLGFLDYVVAPFWNALQAPFPLLTNPLIHLKQNRAQFASWLDD